MIRGLTKWESGTYVQIACAFARKHLDVAIKHRLGELGAPQVIRLFISQVRVQGSIAVSSN